MREFGLFAGSRRGLPRVRQELPEALQGVRDAWGDLQTLGAVYDPAEQARKQAAVIKAVAVLAQRALKVGALNFAEFYDEVVAALGESIARKLKSTMQREWEKVKPAATDEPDKSPATEVAAVKCAIVETMPEDTCKTTASARDAIMRTVDGGIESL